MNFSLWLRTKWCLLMHTDLAYAGGKTYRCRRCLIEWPVLWQTAEQPERYPELRGTVCLVERANV